MNENTFHCNKAVSQLNVYHFLQQNENKNDSNDNNGK